jgi:hypothetical protein
VSSDIVQELGRENLFEGMSMFVFAWSRRLEDYIVRRVTWAKAAGQIL